MIVGDSVKCANCNHEYRIRYNVGNKFPQKALFHCKTCGEKITYGFAKNHSKILINAVKIDDNYDLLVINLHPELPIDPLSESDPRYFPSLDFMKHQLKKGGDGLIEMRKAQLSMNAYIELWDQIQQDFRYLNEQRWVLLEKKYGSIHEKIESQILKKVIKISTNYFEGKRWNDLFKKVVEEVDKISLHPEYFKIKNFLNGYKNDFLIQKMYSIMKKYRDLESFLLPTLLSQKCDILIEGFSSSPDWEKINKIYGDIYEVYGELLLIPTAINNFIQRGDFEKFATEGFTIEKFMDTDKAGRNRNFSTNENLKLLADYYDAGIRNSTHHEAYTYLIEDQIIVMKTGKGGKIEKKIALLDYIIHCNELYARCLILFNVFFKIVLE
jgi:hypothetical protein